MFPNKDIHIFLNRYHIFYYLNLLKLGMAVNKCLILKLFTNVVHYLVNEHHITIIFNDKITMFV